VEAQRGRRFGFSRRDSFILSFASRKTYLSKAPSPAAFCAGPLQTNSLSNSLPSVDTHVLGAQLVIHDQERSQSVRIVLNRLRPK